MKGFFNAIKGFVGSLLNIESEKNDIIVWCLIFAISLGFWKTFKYGDFPVQLLLLVQSLIVAVGAISVTKSFINKTTVETVVTDSRGNVETTSATVPSVIEDLPIVEPLVVDDSGNENKM